MNSIAVILRELVLVFLGIIFVGAGLLVGDGAYSTILFQVSVCAA